MPVREAGASCGSSFYERCKKRNNARAFVQMPLEQQKPTDRSARQQANELISLIRKLRWMGMEEEAQRVQTELAQRAVQPADSVLAAPRETD